MARIAGVDLNNEKRTDIALTYIYGIGRSNVLGVLKTANVDGSKRVKDLSEEEINKLAKAIEGIIVEGDLRRKVGEDIKRLEDIGAYRGFRHRKGLPSRGQRTRSNARTRKGKRKTVGTVRKEVAEKTGTVPATKTQG
ncbi:30S ribosomal protein S13 [Candidatus Daviesbacteria bacterium]|nr:30S ribosomal protein S13 [Candidatus Daviesbacteria bacterium]